MGKGISDGWRGSGFCPQHDTPIAWDNVDFSKECKELNREYNLEFKGYYDSDYFIDIISYRRLIDVSLDMSEALKKVTKKHRQQLRQRKQQNR